MTDAQGEVLDECLQLHGGYGYIAEYDIAEMWADTRAQRICGSTRERMTEPTGNTPRSLRPRYILILWNRGFHTPGPPWSICGKMNGTKAPCPVRGPNGISHRDRASPCTAIGSPACTANRITTSLR
ncbi:acyl-CoA dehydrogenase family protein [Roseovarius sp. SYSU LYC5161]|uniref:acyl-CoA dehydrogenase family protein n=1 Tax=Roseovarius halophilus (ex Wu et al. 2025) TaxID=3376060 RepID=UPI00399A9D0B